MATQKPIIHDFTFWAEGRHKGTCFKLRAGQKNLKGENRDYVVFHLPCGLKLTAEDTIEDATALNIGLPFILALADISEVAAVQKLVPSSKLAALPTVLLKGILHLSPFFKPVWPENPDGIKVELFLEFSYSEMDFRLRIKKPLSSDKISIYDYNAARYLEA